MWKLKKLKPRPGWNEKMDSFPCPLSLSTQQSAAANFTCPVTGLFGRMAGLNRLASRSAAQPVDGKPLPAS